MKCVKCNSSNLEIIKSGPHNKLVCKDCLKFQLFLSKGDANIFNKLKKEEIKPKMTKASEKLFGKFTELSYKIKNTSGIVQNDMEISEEDKENFLKSMLNIRIDLDTLEQEVAKHVGIEINKYDKLMENLLINTNALNEEPPPWN